jgi:hypothetical protein
MQELPDGSIVLPQHVEYQGITPPKGRREHFTGHFHTGTDESRALDFWSYTEFQWGLVIQARPGVVDLANQVPFRWRDADGATRTHTFDFVAYMADGSRTAIMVKAATRLQSDRLRKEHQAIASQVTRDFADRVVVMTEKHIDRVELFNAELMHEMRRPDPATDAAARRAVKDLVGAVRVRDLVDHIGLGADGFRAIVRLVRSRELDLAEHARLTHDALVRRTD